jgi:hypothetical protein
VDGAVIGFPNIEELNEHASAYNKAGLVRRTIMFTEVDDWDREMNSRLREPK